MTAGCDIAPRPRVDFHDFARRENLLFLRHRSRRRGCGTVRQPRPARRYSTEISQVLRSVVADLAVRTFAELPQIGTVVCHRRVERRYAVSSTCGLPFGEDRAIVLSAGENTPRGVGELRQCRAGGWLLSDVEGLIAKKSLLRISVGISLGPVGAAHCGKALGVTAGRQHPVEVYVRKRGNEIADAGGANRQAIDLLEAARSIR